MNDRPLRLLTLVSSLEKGGVCRTAQNFAEAYRDLGHDSKVLTLAGGPRRTGLEQGGIEVTVGLGVEGLHALQGWQPDAIHLHAHGFDPSQVNHVLDAFPGARVIEKSVFSIPTPWSHRVDVSHQMSRWCLWLYQQRGRRRPSAPAVLIPNPIDTTAFAPAPASEVDELRRSLDLPSGALVLGRVGQAYRGKWSTRLIDVFENVATDDRVHLLLVNPPVEVVAAVRRSHFADRIRIVERIDGDSELCAAYTLIDVFMHIAEQGESFGNVLLEAGMCETPVVTLSTPWGDNSQVEVVNNRYGGLVATTIKGFTAATALLLQDAQLRTQLGISARRNAGRFDRVEVASQVIQLVTETAKPTTATWVQTTDVAMLLAATENPPPLLSRIIVLRLPKFRYLLIYVAGLKPWRHFVVRSMVVFLRSGVHHSRGGS